MRIKWQNDNILGISFRPIVSNIGTASYPLARFLAHTLSPLTASNSHTVKNSFDFVNKLKSFSPVDCTMLSLDVKSLFTNVPVVGAISCLECRLHEFHYSDIEIREILSLTKLCVENTAFVFNGSFYTQTDGLAMGNPLSPILCDIYMHYFEEVLLSKFNFKCWLRYVDDTFVLVDKNFDRSQLLSLVNSIDPCIQFTHEEESNNKLSFLDVLVSKNGSVFSTSVFRKPFSVSMPPHVNSSHPWQQKVSAFYSYTYRALRLCSDPQSLKSEVAFLKSLAVYRGYNPSIIDVALRKFNKPVHESTLHSKVFNSKNVVILPFYSRLSYKISRILSRFGFRIVFKPVNKVCFPLPKDPIPSFDRWGVYRIPCECGLAYVSQTKRALKLRVGEHKRYVSKQEVSKSSISEHSWNAGHVFQFDNIKILFTPPSASELAFL